MEAQMTSRDLFGADWKTLVWGSVGMACVLGGLYILFQG